MPENQKNKNPAADESVSIVLLNTVFLVSGYHYPDEIIKCEKSEAARLIRLNAALPCAEFSPDEMCGNPDLPPDPLDPPDLSDPDLPDPGLLNLDPSDPPDSSDLEESGENESEPETTGKNK